MEELNRGHVSRPSHHLTWASLVIALIALGGSLWLSVGMGLKACPLCFYQRTFVMGVAAVIGFGFLINRCRPEVLNLLAFPMAVGALGVALFHVYLEVTGTLECPVGISGIGTAPQQSLTILTILVLVMGLGEVVYAKASSHSRFSIFAGVGLGLLLAMASIVSAPPLPNIPAKAYETPLDICRPPFRP